MIYQYPHAKLFEGWTIPDFESYQGNIVLWGAGKVGGVAAHCFKKRGVKISAFCDISKEKWGTTFCGHKVISPEELKKQHPNAAVVVSNSFPSSVYPQLMSMGFKNVFDCVSLFMEIDFENYEFWMTPEFSSRIIENYMRNILFYKRKNFFLERILLVINSKCTLRCRYCDAYIPYIKSPKNFNADHMIDNCKDVFDAVGSVQAVDILGGEPLIHPHLKKILMYLKTEQRVEKVQVITNGTIVPNNDIINIIKDDKFRVRISNYGKLSSHMDEILRLLEKENIKFEITNYIYWDSLPQIKATNETHEELSAKFQACTTNLFYLQDGKLFYCNAVAGLQNVDAKILPESENNYLDLSNYKLKTEREAHIVNFLNRLYKGEYIDACRYCSGSHCIQFENKVPVAEQTKELLTFPRMLEEGV